MESALSEMELKHPNPNPNPNPRNIDEAHGDGPERGSHQEHDAYELWFREDCETSNASGRIFRLRERFTRIVYGFYDYITGAN